MRDAVGPEPELIGRRVRASNRDHLCALSFTSAAAPHVYGAGSFTRSMLQREEMKLPRVSAHVRLSLPL